jgi:hypothetical protein
MNICTPNSDGKLKVRNEHVKEKELVRTEVDPVATYFITIHKPITQLVAGCPSSDRLIVITSFSTSKLSKNLQSHESVHCSALASC